MKCVYCDKETNDKVFDIPFCIKHRIKNLVELLKKRGNIK